MIEIDLVSADVAGFVEGVEPELQPDARSATSAAMTKPEIVRLMSLRTGWNN